MSLHLLITIFIFFFSPQISVRTTSSFNNLIVNLILILLFQSQSLWRLGISSPWIRANLDDTCLCVKWYHNLSGVCGCGENKNDGKERKSCKFWRSQVGISRNSPIHLLFMSIFVVVVNKAQIFLFLSCKLIFITFFNNPQPSTTHSSAL